MFRDLLVDALGNEGPYESFVETKEGLKAYVPSDKFDEAWLRQQLSVVSGATQDGGCPPEGENPSAQCGADVSEQWSVDSGQWSVASGQCATQAVGSQFSILTSHFSIREMEDKDWNEEWEKSHQAVLVRYDAGRRDAGAPREGTLWVRAPFHPHRDDVDYELIIEPKMSFGTAHHPTTYMMLSYVAELDMQGKRVLDMGCGTAVLAILAKKRGASYVEGIDVDEWAYRNAQENVAANGVEVTLRLGDAGLLAEGENPSAQCGFDVIIANINRNILLADMDKYAAVLADGGTLLLSGFYEADEEALVAKANSLGLTLHSKKNREQWSALELINGGVKRSGSSES